MFEVVRESLFRKLTVLETERLRLRHFHPGDAAFALELLNEPDFLRYIGDKRVRDLEGARAYLRDGPMAMVAEHGHGLHLVEDKATCEALGMCGLIRRPGLEHVDVGFAFLARFRRRGYGFESARAVMRHGREQLGLGTIVAIASPDNAASAALLAKLGLFPAGPIHLVPDEEPSLLFTPEGNPEGNPDSTP